LTLEKTCVYIECDGLKRKRVKSKLISRSQDQIVVETPNGYVMTLIKKTQNDFYLCRLGQLEFISNGQLI